MENGVNGVCDEENKGGEKEALVTKDVVAVSVVGHSKECGNGNGSGNGSNGNSSGVAVVVTNANNVSRDEDVAIVTSEQNGR